jgi:hypothetical protein
MPRTKQQPKKVDIAPLVEEALKTEENMSKVVETLSDSSRRERQTASSIVYEVAKQDISKVEPFVKDIIDALNRPEVQTRWKALLTLTLLIPTDSKNCMKAIEAAEDSLFDEMSGPLRLSAFVFLCNLGSTTTSRSKTVWPLIDEAIQCYHGDIEFFDMLDALTLFSKGKLDAEVKEELSERMAFDAENAAGKLKAMSEDIIENLKPKSKRSKK